MSPRIEGGLIFSAICLLWPGLCFAAGLLIGRHGIKHAAYLVLARFASKGELAQSETQ